MKEVAVLTTRQDTDEPRLKIRIYRSDANFYIRVECDHPGISFIPFCMKAANFLEVKSQSAKLLHLLRGLFRQALGKAPDLPEDMKQIESEIPAFLNRCLTHKRNVFGRN